MLPIYYESGGAAHMVEADGIYEITGDEPEGIAIITHGDHFSVPIFGVSFQDYLKAYAHAAKTSQGYVDVYNLQCGSAATSSSGVKFGSRDPHFKGPLPIQ